MKCLQRSSESDEICDCKSGNRSLVLLAKDFSHNFHELVEFETSENWNYLQEYKVLQVRVGHSGRWKGVSDVVNFVRSVVIDEKRVAEIRAAWISNQEPLAQQLVEIFYNAQPLPDFAPLSDSSELLEVLRAKRIETWFQPVINARTGQIWGYECLMRGRRTDGSIIGAPQLLDWSRAENLTFMLDRVCREIHLENAGRLNFDESLKFLINFLPTAIYQPEFCLKSSLAAARRSGLSPQQIIFEVVETEKIEDRKHLERILDFYRRAGFGVALDDLGSGYAGLSLLGDLHPDLIKIDRDIVAKSTVSIAHKNICASLVKLGKDNNQLVLAEGVETIAEKMLMDEMGVDLFQGYLFGKPSPEPLTIPPLIAQPSSLSIAQANFQTQH